MAEIIRFDNVRVDFSRGDEQFTAVDGVSLSINKGEFFGIVGASGAGKSTLVRTINLLQRPTSGHVIVDGTDVTDLKGRKLSALRLKIGMIFQHFNLIKNATVFDNVAFALEASGTPRRKIAPRVVDLLRLVGLEDKIRLYPGNLSGGQKQRVAIARALANDPEILLCDEATSALDPDNTAEVIDSLKRIKESYPITVVFITHQEQVARSLFDRIAVMEKGKVVEVGDAYQIFAHPQAQSTKDLVSRSTEYELPPEVLDREKDLYLLNFKEDHAYDAVIAEVARRFDSDLSIIAGKIDYIRHKPLGVLLVSLRTVSETKREEIISFIKERAYVTPYKRPANA
ncbi:MAG: methionine ABC transporter ATP-binding protein [Succinatimonas hippei]|nr:methionine ABC transporter ATP-binding protein [Succinatimonas hippei]